jgi:hypothetical protein
MAVHSVEALVPQPTNFEVKTATAIETGHEPIYSEIHKLIHFNWNKKELPCM